MLWGEGRTQQRPLVFAKNAMQLIICFSLKQILKSLHTYLKKLPCEMKPPCHFYFHIIKIPHVIGYKNMKGITLISWAERSVGLLHRAVCGSTRFGCAGGGKITGSNLEDRRAISPLAPERSPRLPSRPSNCLAQLSQLYITLVESIC